MRWTPASGFSGLYEVSEEGSVRRVGGGRGARAGRVLTPTLRQDGYLSVCLSRGNQQARVLLHRLVCLTFHGDPPTDDHEVAHINGVRADVRATNLRWSTRVDNHADKIAHGTSYAGVRHHAAKVTDAQVAEIRAARGHGVPLAELAERFGISQSQVSRIANGVNWRRREEA